METIEKMEFFEIDELRNIYRSEEIFLSVDVKDLTNGCLTNIIENKSVKLEKFPNTLEIIGKKYSCEKKIMKFLQSNCEFTLKTKFEKKGIFEYSISIAN